jgi:hypothetical protein
MDFVKPHEHIDANTYDFVVSIGNKCPTAMILRDIRVYKESFPFDYVPTTPALILKYLKDQTDFFPKKGITRTSDGVCFGHFDTDAKHGVTIDMFRRRFERLFEALKSKKRILFVYTSEADIYNEMGNRYNDNYGDLIKLRDYIRATYHHDNFMIAAVHMNKTFANGPNIVNYTINVAEQYLSDNMETHVRAITRKYRDTLRKLMREVFTTAE